MNRMLCSLIIICAAAVFPARAGAPAPILKQVAAGLKPDDTIYWLEADLDGDGSDDLLVATSEPIEPELPGDSNWTIYRGLSAGGYTKVGGARKFSNGQNPVAQPNFTMRLNGGWVGQIPELGKRGLLHLLVGNGGQSKTQLMAVVLDGPGFVEQPIGKALNSELFYEVLAARLKGPGALVMRRSKVSELP